MHEALTSTQGSDWQFGQGFDSALPLHLHLLIKCHNNMIFNYQTTCPHTRLRRDRRRQQAEA